MEKHELVALYRDNQWYAWHVKDHETKYRGRTLVEAVGKLLIKLLVPETMTITAVGPSGNFCIPITAPCCFMSDDLKKLKMPYETK